jgi:hypothetical protein
LNDVKIISFEDYRKQNAGSSYREDALSAIFKKDLREQTDLLSWYLFHRNFNKFKLFVHCLFSENHQKQNPNPNSGYVIAFREDQIEERVTALIEAIKWEKRDYVLIQAAGRTYRQFGEFLRGYLPNTNQEAHEFFKDDLLRSDKVIIIQELSRSRISGRKADYARSLIKILDDAHFDGIHPTSDLIFVDYGDFLHKSWSSIGTYLDVLA